MSPQLDHHCELTPPHPILEFAKVDDVPTDAAGVADSIVQNAIAEEHAPQSPTATGASLDSWGLIGVPLFC